MGNEKSISMRKRIFALKSPNDNAGCMFIVFPCAEETPVQTQGIPRVLFHFVLFLIFCSFPYI